MKRKPHEPDQNYWLDLPAREPLSFCQANSAPTSLPHTPDPTSPSLFPSFRLFLFLRHGCSNLVLRLGTHWAVAMVTGKLLVPCASKGTFPLLEFLPSLHTAQWDCFSFACWRTSSSSVTLLWRKGKAVLPTIPVACLHPLYCDDSTCICLHVPVCSPLFFLCPSHFWSEWHLSRQWNTTQQCHCFFISG